MRSSAPWGQRLAVQPDPPRDGCQRSCNLARSSFADLWKLVSKQLSVIQSALPGPLALFNPRCYFCCCLVHLLGQVRWYIWFQKCWWHFGLNTFSKEPTCLLPGDCDFSRPHPCLGVPKGTNGKYLFQLPCLLLLSSMWVLGQLRLAHFSLYCGIIFSYHMVFIGCQTLSISLRWILDISYIL